MTYTQITPHERYAISALRKQGTPHGRDRAAAGTSPQHDRPGGAPQCVARGRAHLSRLQGAGLHEPPPAQLAAEHAVHRRATGPRVEARAPGGLEPRAGRRLVRALRDPRDQPRDDLSLHLGGQAGAGGTSARAPAPRDQALPEALRRATTVAGGSPASGHISTRPAGAEHRSRVGHWEGDTVLGNSAARGLRRHAGRAEDRLRGDRQAPQRRGRRRERASRSSSDASHTPCAPSPPTTGPSSTPTRRSSGGSTTAVLLRDAAPLVGTRERTRT